MADPDSNNEYWKSADAGTRLDVDEAILDYLLYTAVKALLKDRQARKHDSIPTPERRKADLPLQMVECQFSLPYCLHDLRLTLAAFLVMFHFNYPDHRCSSTVQFRLCLLKFAALFTRRMEASESSLAPPTLQTLKAQHQQRAKAFLSHYDVTLSLDLTPFGNSLPFPESVQQAQRRRVLCASVSDLLADHYGSPNSLSLLDTLPSFMALSAAQNTLQGNNVTYLWMRLAARYMAEAVLEQYLIYGAHGSDIIQEAFAYGFDPESISASDSEELAITNLFWGGEDGREVQGWEEIRDEHLKAVSKIESPQTRMDTAQTCL